MMRRLRFGALAAAAAALWTQPASAVEVLSQQEFVHRDWVHNFYVKLKCEDAYPCTYEAEWVFESTWSEGFLRNPAYAPGSLHNFTKLEVNGTDYLGNRDDVFYLQPIPLLPTGNVLKFGGHVPWFAHTPWVVITRTAVPEPATWAMMFVGFGAVGWQLRRRPRNSRLAPA